MATILKRVKLNERTGFSKDIQELAREAQVILQHDDLANRVLSATEKLSVVLHRLDIKPYKRDTVRQYQEEKREEANNKPGGYYYWRRTPLKWATDVPLFVLRKAIEIKRAAPDVKLFVEQLENHPDPFLIAKLGAEEFYVEVWDEKDFEKGL